MPACPFFANGSFLALNDSFELAAQVAEPHSPIAAAKIRALKVKVDGVLPVKPPLRISEGYAAHLAAVEKARHCDCEARA